MNFETAAAIKWCESAPEVVEEIHRLAQEDAASLAATLESRVKAAMPYTIGPDEPPDYRAKIIEALREVDWQAVADHFIRFEAWRARGRKIREKREAARRKRCRLKGR